jgi:hypothetical protein
LTTSGPRASSDVGVKPSPNRVISLRLDAVAVVERHDADDLELAGRPELGPHDLGALALADHEAALGWR